MEKMGIGLPDSYYLSILTNKFEMTVVRPKITALPQVSTDGIIRSFGSRAVIPVTNAVQLMTEFLGGYAIADGIEDHSQRRAIRDVLAKKYGPKMEKILYTENKFRLHQLGSMKLAHGALLSSSRNAGHDDMTESLRATLDYFNDLLPEDPERHVNPRPRYDRLPIESKTGIVIGFEEATLSTLAQLSTL